MTSAARAWRILVLALASVVVLSARAQAAPVASGASDGAWFVATPRLGGAVLTYLDATKPNAGIIVTQFAQSPVALAAGERLVVAAFSPEVTDGVALRPMRRVNITTAPNAVEVFTRARALPPLPSGAPLSGLIVVDQAVVALTISPAALWVLAGDAWTSHPLPDGFTPGDASWLVRAQGNIGLCAFGAPDNALLWTAAATIDAEHPELVWTSNRVALPPSTRDLVGVGPHLFAGYPGPNGATLELALVRPTDWINRASIEVNADAPTLACIGDRLILLTTGAKDPLRTEARVVALDGTIAESGPIESASPLSPQDLQIVIFGVMGVVVAAMLFALRTESSAVIRIPDGFVIAPPARRFVATIIDLIPGALVGWVVASIPSAAAGPADPITAGIAAGFLATLLCAAIPEAATGRTLGKLALGLRTIAVTGHRPTWAQALGRNLSKLVFPPLALLILINPAIPTPGSCGTIVVMRRPPDAPSDPPRDA